MKHDKIVFISAGATAFLVLRVFFVILDNPLPTLNHAICSATHQTLLKHKYTDKVTDSDGFLYFVKYTFSFGFRVGFEGNNEYAKKVLRRHGMR